MVIKVLLEKSIVEKIRDHFNNHLMEERLLSVDSGSLSRRFKYSQIITALDDALLCDATEKILYKRAKKGVKDEN